MQEQRRQAYLAAMGVRVMYPREVVAGARRSPAYDLPAPLPAGSPDADQEISGAQSERSRPLRPASPRARPLGKPTADAADQHSAARQAARHRRTAASGAEPKPAPVAPAQPAAALQPFSFTVRYFEINEQLAVIDELPAGADEQVMTQTETLLGKILFGPRALGLDPAHSRFQASVVNLPAQLPVDADPAQAAAKLLQGYIQARALTGNFSALLIFADLTRELLMAPQGSATPWDYQPPGATWFMTVTHSLQAMLTDPSGTVKETVWKQHLQPLRRRLQS